MMADQWPDPNGKWTRRMRRWTLPIGIAYLLAVVAEFALRVTGQERATAFGWFYLGLSGIVACSLIGMGIAYRRHFKDR